MKQKEKTFIELEPCAIVGLKRGELLLEQIVEQYGEYLYHLSYLYMKDFQLAEEITQDVLMKYLLHKDDFRKDASLKTYLTRIAIPFLFVKNLIDSILQELFSTHLDSLLFVTLKTFLTINLSNFPKIVHSNRILLFLRKGI